MALVRWNPWSELFTLHSQMDQLFQSMAPESESRNGGMEQVTLPVDIRQSDEAFIIEASVPGFAPEDVEVTFDDNVLTIRGTINAERTSENGGYVRRERRMGSVFRQIALPAEVRADEISASFSNGVLAVTVPRAAKAQPKRIPVQPGDAPGERRQLVEGTASNSAS